MPGERERGGVFPLQELGTLRTTNLEGLGRQLTSRQADKQEAGEKRPVGRARAKVLGDHTHARGTLDAGQPPEPAVDFADSRVGARQPRPAR